MKGIQIKLQGEWIVLPPDFSIKLEQSNSLFNDQGTFSFPFEVPLEPNRFLFKNIADPFRNINLKDIDGMDAELWFNGILLYRGIIETDEEIEFDDAIPMTFMSGNSDLMTKIGDLKAQDIPLDREIKLGYFVNRAFGEKEKHEFKTVYFPENIMMNYTGVNVSDPYPLKPYCNVRVCTSDENGKYKVLDARRPFSGVCFYMMYLLNCLFEYLHITIQENQLSKIDDFNRLAFFTTKCKYRMSDNEIVVPLSEIKDKDFCGPEFTLFYKYKWVRKFELNTEDFVYYAKEIFATSENYPDVSIKDIIEDLNNAFGVRMIYDNRENNVKLILLKNIFKDDEIKDIDVTVLNSNLTRYKSKNLNLTYGNKDNDAFNFKDLSNAEELSYEEIVENKISAYNKTRYVDIKTGDAYVIKVNKKTGKDPALFEVDGFRDYYSNENEKENLETRSIQFSPVIVNDVAPKSTSEENKNNQLFAIFSDVQLNSKSIFDGVLEEETIGGEFFNRTTLKSKVIVNYDFKENDESPLQSYDAGYTLGIMRGAGNKSGIEYEKNYDGEGNDSWEQVSSDYAFTSDSCDNYGRFFDYNGTEEGGSDQEERFSLKLVAGKYGFQIDSKYAYRGLVDKFLSEYYYFLEHRKTVLLEVKMDITQLLNIDFIKRYKVGDFVGFINKISYTITTNGMEDVIIEMYTL